MTTRDQQWQQSTDHYTCSLSRIYWFTAKWPLFS